jgi:hypothetical protein
MPEVTPVSPEHLRSLSAFARSLVAAGRSRALYPPDHPAVRTSVDRLASALRRAGATQPLALGITPDTLILDDAPLPGDGPVAEAAAWLHERDILRLLFLPDADGPALQALLALLAEDPRTVRQRGGPAAAWTAAGHPAIGIEQIDFSQVLEDRDVEHPARRKDDLWRAIVQAVIDRRKTLDEAVQRRLLEISGNVLAIADLAQDVMAPSRAADGSPMLTSQAAAVVAAYHHLVGIVDVMEPARRAEVMQNLASATASLDPRVVLQMLGGPDEAGIAATGAAGPGIKRSLADAFDDVKVAQLLATTLALDGQATGRLAEVFDTIAPDEPRKRRVLTLTQSLLSETSFGQTTQFKTLWTSMEELLLTYNEKPFVSSDYQQGLDGAGARAERMASGDVPADLAALVDTLGQDNVRRLSCILLVDLLRLERDPARAPELARDVAALAEDLLLSGDYDDALMVSSALAEEAQRPGAVTREGCRQALDALAGTPAFVEAAGGLADMADGEAGLFEAICGRIGPAAADALVRWLDVDEMTTGRARATRIIGSYGARAVSRLSGLAGAPNWYARRNAADLLGEIAAPEGVPLLQPMLRGADPRVTQAAVRALSSIDDPAAARAVHTVLRAAGGTQRLAVVNALVAERDPRVVPVLMRILDESEPFGTDHAIVLDTLQAIGQIGHDQAVPSVTALMTRRRWFARGKSRALKQAALSALRAIGSSAAETAITEARDHGDRLLRRLARDLGGPSHG